MKSKGEVFLIAAVVIVSSVFILRASTFTSSSVEEIKKFEVRLESAIFENLVNELRNSVRYSLYNGRNITTNVHDFGNFTKYKLAGHSFTLQILFIGATANMTESMLNVSVVNFLGESVTVNLTIDTKSQQSSVADYGRWDTNFTITPGTNYVMTAVYNQTVHSMTIKTKSSKDVYNYFFDTGMVGDNSVHKDLDSSHYNIN